MSRSPDRLNLDHLKKQAKDLIRDYRRGDADAMARLRRALPAAAGRGDDDLAALGLKLHDAQSCIARDNGFLSWADLKRYVEAQSTSRDDRADLVRRWLGLVYAGDLHGTEDRANPRVAVRMLAEHAGLVGDDPYLACAVGDAAVLQRATQDDPAWLHRPGGPLALPPLVAVAHSSLLQVPEFRDRLHRCAQQLLAAGADVNQRVSSRLPPASLNAPDDRYPLSALYGAAGQNHDVALTAMLLDAGADPNDGESLYHSLENPACTRLLLEHGARVTGSNALYRALDLPGSDAIELLLQHGGDANEPAGNAPLTDWGTPLLWAIRRRQSVRHVAALLKAGADPTARSASGIGAYSLALQFGLEDVAQLLRAAGAAEATSEDELFVAACARGDANEARRLQARRPDLPAALSAAQLRLLPDMAAGGGDAGARLMVELGWPITIRGGDWDASALNLAVFRGNAELTRFLLAHGATWTEEHGFGDNVSGTLSWASCNEPVEGGDWVGCARVLLDAGMPSATPDPEDADAVLIAGRSKRFSDAVTEVLLAPRDQA